MVRGTSVATNRAMTGNVLSTSTAMTARRQFGGARERHGRAERHPQADARRDHVARHCENGQRKLHGQAQADEMDGFLQVTVIIDQRVERIKLLFIAQRFDGLQPAGAPGWIHAEYHADGHADAKGDGNRTRLDLGLKALSLLQLQTSCRQRNSDANGDADDASQTSHRQGLDQELCPYGSGDAPMALRTPISRVRSVTLTSMMFMMPMPPTISEIAPIAPRKAVSAVAMLLKLLNSDVGTNSVNGSV